MWSKNFIKKVAQREGVSPQFLTRQLSSGKALIASNKKNELPDPCAIGEGLKVKINTNIGTSSEHSSQNNELAKLRISLKHGTHAVMDLSTGGDLSLMRRKIRKACPVALGTVPVYEAALAAEKKYQTFEKMTFDDIWDVLKAQAEDGVDFFTIHAGLLHRFLRIMQAKPRVGSVVSRGGGILVRWMHVNAKENPFYEHFDDILSLAKKYRITLSLGDALRPGAVSDSSDTLQLSELYILGELVKRAQAKGVAVMVEGPGHIRFDEIAFNMQIEKKICNGAPFYVLGPLVTDIAAGYDHIVSAIGGALAAYHGADFLCVVTPAEHLRHPSQEDIKDGVIASKIAAHCIDLLRFKDEWARDLALSKHRAKREWKESFKLTLDESKARKYKEESRHLTDMCSMCGNLCSLKIVEKCKLFE